MSTRILLADCDQMFVAVARLVDPEGAGRAQLLVVGGSAKSRGVVCSASYEVRAFGVRSGMPISRAARLCPDATFVPVPRKACMEKSREAAAALRRWAPKVEAASIDEFYLDLTGTEAVYRHEPLADTAARLRLDVKARTGLSMSVGGGTNRLVAKLAAERAKPRPGTDGTGVRIVSPGNEAAFLATHQLAEIPGVGPRLQEQLKRYGLVSVQDALRVEARELKTWLGRRGGAWLYQRIRGEGTAEVDSDGEAKSMSREETFAVDLTRDEDLERALLALCTRLAADLRAAGLKARSVGVKLRDHDFKTRLATRTLDEPIDSNRAIYQLARELQAGLRQKRRVPARLLGVALSRFESCPRHLQLGLLDPPAARPIETAKDRAVAQTVDAINRRFGPDAVKPARLTE